MASWAMAVGLAAKVQLRIAQAAAAALAARPKPLQPADGAQQARMRAPRPPQPSAGTLKQQLERLGHELVQIGKAAHRTRVNWACHRCHRWASHLQLRDWVQDGPCVPLEGGPLPCRSPPVRLGQKVVHASHSMVWIRAKAKWVCRHCAAEAWDYTSKKLTAPCTRLAASCHMKKVQSWISAESRHVSPRRQLSKEQRLAVSSQKFQQLRNRIISRHA